MTHSSASRVNHRFCSCCKLFCCVVDCFYKTCIAAINLFLGRKIHIIANHCKSFKESDDISVVNQYAHLLSLCDADRIVTQDTNLSQRNQAISCVTFSRHLTITCFSFFTSFLIWHCAGLFATALYGAIFKRETFTE